jgi:hypothetical protein
MTWTIFRPATLTGSLMLRVRRCAGVSASGISLAQHAEVTFTHGDPQLPAPVKVVALELTTRAMEMPSGIAKQIQSGPYSIGLGALGVVPTDEQRRRLGPYTLVRF